MLVRLSKLQSLLVDRYICLGVEVLQLNQIRNWHQTVSQTSIPFQAIERVKINRKLRSLTINGLIRPLLKRSVLYRVGDGGYLLNRSCLIERLSSSYRWLIDTDLSAPAEQLVRYSCEESE